MSLSVLAAFAIIAGFEPRICAPMGASPSIFIEFFLNIGLWAADFASITPLKVSLQPNFRASVLIALSLYPLRGAWKNGIGKVIFPIRNLLQKLSKIYCFQADNL